MNIKSFILSASNLNSKALDFGSGPKPRNIFLANELYSIDLIGATSKNHSVIKNGDPLPFEENYFDRISAYDVLEHLSRDPTHNDFIFYMNELCRVLKPGGIALFVFPSYPHIDAITDPTHVNFISKSTIDYVLGSQKGSYAQIYTSYRLIVNRKIRVRKHFDPSYKQKDVIGLRRRLSLVRRELKNLTNPSHRVWILEKIKQD